MRILGISAFYHDSAAALVEDGHIIAAAQDERFTRKKAGRALSRECHSLLSRRGRPDSRRARLHRFLREAVCQVRTVARDLSRLRAAGVCLVPHGFATVAQGEIVPEGPSWQAGHSAGARLRLAPQAAVRGATT